MVIMSIDSGARLSWFKFNSAVTLAGHLTMEKLINLSVFPFSIPSVGLIIVCTFHRVVKRIKLVNICKVYRSVMEWMSVSPTKVPTELWNLNIWWSPVCLGRCNNHRLGGKQQKFIFHNFRVWDQVLVKALYWVIDYQLFIVSSGQKREASSLWLLKGYKPIREVPPSWHHLILVPLNTSHWRVGFSMDSGGHRFFCP